MPDYYTNPLNHTEKPQLMS